MSETVKRTVKGGRSAFFDNPDVDRLLAMLMRLMTEHWALKERVLTLEALLAEHKLLPEGAVESFEPGPEEDARRDLESFAFIQAVIEAAQNIDPKTDRHPPATGKQARRS